MAIQINKIESAIMEFPNGSNVPVGKYINLPIAWESVLDETHGTAKILMTDMRQADFEEFGARIDKPFDVGTPIEIKFVGQETRIRMIVARDTAEKARKDGFETWSHNVELVDEVKKLEQEPVDNLTFRNSISRNYNEDELVNWEEEVRNGSYSSGQKHANGWIPPEFKRFHLSGMIKIDFNASTFNTEIDVNRKEVNVTEITMKLSVTIESLAGSSQTYEYTGETDSFYVTLPAGEHFITFLLDYYIYYSQGSINHFIVAYSAYFSVGRTEMFVPYTIKGVIDRILAVTPTRTINNSLNKYTFLNAAEEYATEESPEFTFTGKHLFEVMLEIANYKKMFPALYKNEIYFRPFWNGVILTSDDLPPTTKAIVNSAIDQYCMAIDSYVENMVCINDSNVGTVVEPYAGGYVSSRSGSGSEISEITAIIPTQSCVYQSTKLVMGDVHDLGKLDSCTTYEVGDIQTYVYEKDDYAALTDTREDTFSKGFALKFARFEKNYTELAHKIKTSGASSGEDLSIHPALTNIVYRKTRALIGATLSSSLGGKTIPYSGLLFQPSYIPVVNARVRQYKPMMTDEDYEATLFYNQQAEVVDSEAFGEHVKGLVQKLGNHTEIRVYRFDRIDEVPTVGTIIDEKSVYNVSTTIYENHVDATICLVEYAELSMYIGVKNEIKTSDISSTKWCNRFINWEEFLVFTHQDFIGDALSVTSKSLNDIVTFNKAESLTCAMFTNYDENGVEISTAFAPIKHLAIGNSIYFQWEMLDNFAVGYQSEEAPKGATSVLEATQYDRSQKAVRYCDGFGRMGSVSFCLLKRGPTPDNSGWRFLEEDIDWEVDESNQQLFVRLKKFHGCHIIVEFESIPNDQGDPASVVVKIKANSTQPDPVHWSYSAAKTKFTRAYIDYGYDGDLDSTKSDKKKWADTFIRTQIAHEYPQKPSNLVFDPSSDKKNANNRPAFQLSDLLVKKNSAEALKFAAQYHFRQDWREFVIGSGMSNFCSLIGGSCSQLQMFISKLPINRFERHVNLGDEDNYDVLKSLPTFKVEEENLRVVITLPDEVNKTEETKSWGLIGTDRNGNHQLIFGENRKGTDPFNLTIYLVARKKNNEPPSRAREICKIIVWDSFPHIDIPFHFYVNGIRYERGNQEFQKGVEVIVKGVGSKEFYFDDGVAHTVSNTKTYTFKLENDITYSTWRAIK